MIVKNPRPKKSNASTFLTHPRATAQQPSKIENPKL